MNYFSATYDVCIVGAGPAGLCAALRLLEMGYSVGMIEREPFPRPQIGESLSPGVRNIFSYLQAGHLLDDPVYLTHLPASVIWEKKSEIYRRPGGTHAGLVVDRSKLDQALLALAVTNGLQLMQPASLQSATNTAEGWSLAIHTNGSVKTCFSRVVLDARGRNGAPFRDRVPMAPLSVAIWTHFSTPPGPKHTLVEAVDEGWLWASPVAGDQFRIMAFTDAGATQKKPCRLLVDLMRQATLLAEHADHISADRIKTCAVSPFVHCTPWHNQFIKLGEAAFALDPLSSSGLEKAMRFSLQTAIAVNTYLKQPDSDDPIHFYEEKLIDAVVSHARWTKDYYAQTWTVEKERGTFWGKRVDFRPDFSAYPSRFIRRLNDQICQPFRVPGHHQPAAIPIHELTHFLWNTPVRLSPLTEVRNTFSIQNDIVALNEAIDHPNLETPLRYVDQINIVPLLADRKWITLGNFIESCQRVMAIDRAKKIAAFLWYKNILVTH